MDREAESVDSAAEATATARNNEDLESLSKRVERLEAALRSRDAFLRVAAHELRGPLAAIQLQADTISILVNQGASPGDVDARASRVSGQVQRLARLLEEVLDLARASSGRLQLLRGEVDLAAVVHDALDRARDDLRRSGSDIDLATGSAVVGPWDQARLEHAVAAVIAAAIKTGGGSPIAISTSATAAEARLDVRWGGSGIAASQVALVVGEFEEAVNRAAPGANILALWLARRVAEAHGGGLELDSTRAALRLPLSAGASDGKKLAR